MHIVFKERIIRKVEQVWDFSRRETFLLAQLILYSLKIFNQSMKQISYTVHFRASNESRSK